MPDFIFPTSAELKQIEQDKLPRLIMNRPIFKHFPIEDVDAFLLMWEQEDNFTGLQGIRGLNGQPNKVNRIGLKRYQAQPGVYGDFISLDETELTVRRVPGTFGTPSDISPMVMQAQDQLLERRLDRIELTLWKLAVNGTYSVLGAQGQVMATDTYTTQSFTAVTPWSTFATATPLADLRTIQLLRRGHSFRLDTSAEIYMNQKTWNNMISNTNPNDLGGRRTNGLATVNSPGDLAKLLSGDNLPSIVVYDEGYLPDGGGAFIPFIPDNKAVVFGTRNNGATIGNYRQIRNVNNEGMAPGAYQKVIDTGETAVPRNIDVHDGHNGGPVIYFPSALIVAGSL